MVESEARIQFASGLLETVLGGLLSLSGPFQTVGRLFAEGVHYIGRTWLLAVVQRLCGPQSLCHTLFALIRHLVSMVDISPASCPLAAMTLDTGTGMVSHMLLPPV
jgi:hypothetical protein